MLDLASLGIILILAGFGILFLATLGLTNEERGNVKGGGVILIGPVPIIFGSDMKWAAIAILLAILLVLISIFYLA
jgi:uncharacterized protein (TIGR00304 family)